MQLYQALFCISITLVSGLGNTDDEIDEDLAIYTANDSFRLPTSIKPIHYRITIEPSLETDLELPPFNGSVAIELNILESTKNITLHAQSLNIDESSITIGDSNGTNLKFFNTTTDRAREFYIIHLEDELQKGEIYKLIVGKFTGTLNSKKVGFYLAKYENLQGQESKLAVTQFEASHARRAFPCFDEPAMKAKFAINIIRGEGYTSFSNEELAETKFLGNGRYQDIFKETVVMSTYTVAFSVSNYKHTKRIHRIRVLAQPEAIEDGRADYALIEASKLLEALEDYTGINYTLSKMDLLSVPDEYFLPGAMENWGLIIYGEQYLLHSKISSTTEDLQRRATFSAHELAHQWFGNLVTPNWWRYMWLSEGFAAYFQYHIADVVEPSWRLTEQYVTEHFQLALKSDDIRETEPMSYEPDYYGSLPSVWIMYYKACAVIRMAEHFLTSPIFKSGLNIYLQENKFGAVEPLHLYKAFQQEIDRTASHGLLGNLSVSAILTTWDSNRGYPLVTATRNYATGLITLSQTIYRNDGPTNDTNIWYIPINYIFQLNNKQDFSKTTADLWLTKETIVVDNNFPTDGWLLLNKKQTGYYRVNYDMTNWQRIISFLSTKEFKSIHPVNRAQLIDDSFNLAASGHLSYEIPLNLSRYLIQETDLIPITAFLKSVEHLNDILSASEEYDIFQNYVKNLLNGALEDLGFNERSNDSHTDKLNRMKILPWLCNFQHSDCADVGLEKLRLWKTNDSVFIPPDLEEPLLCGAMQIATKNDWNFFYQKYRSTKDTNKKSRYIKALGCVKNIDVLRNMFEVFCHKNNTMSESDKATAINKVVELNNKNLQIVLEYLGTYCADIDKTFKVTVGSSLGHKITTREQLVQAIALNEANNKEYGLIQLYGEDNLEELETNKVPQISKWLLDYSKSNVETSNIV